MSVNLICIKAGRISREKDLPLNEASTHMHVSVLALLCQLAEETKQM